MSQSPADPPPDHGRAFYRVVYPELDRPRVVFTHGTRGRVLDCSENGLRYRPGAGQRLPELGAELLGEVEFRSGPHTRIAGKVVRVAHDEVALHLAAPGIVLRVIFAEQRALRARYPWGIEGGRSGGGGSRDIT